MALQMRSILCSFYARVCARGSISCPYMRIPADPLESVNEAVFYSCHDDQIPMIAFQDASDFGSYACQI